MQSQVPLGKEVTSQCTDTGGGAASRLPLPCCFWAATRGEDQHLRCAQGQSSAAWRRASSRALTVVLLKFVLSAIRARAKDTTMKTPASRFCGLCES